MLAELVRNSDGPAPFLTPLAQSIAAGRDEAEFARALSILTSAPASTQVAVLEALSKGRQNAPQRLADPTARTALARLVASPQPEVRRAALALEATLAITAADDDALATDGTPVPVETLSDARFREFVAALAGPRDLQRGHELFSQACAPCHRLGQEGHDVGPDLLGQLGMAEESLLRELLLPNERLRPGFETTQVRRRDGGVVSGLLKDDGATSLTLAQPGGVEQVLLRQDIARVIRLNTSLMPSFGEGISPADAASLLAWLRSQASPPKSPTPESPSRP